jgi:hypothetical protein
VQHAVDAEAHDELLGLGLEVDVRGRVVDRLRDDGVDELDDRRLFGGVADVRGLSSAQRPSGVLADVALAVDGDALKMSSSPAIAAGWNP